MSFYFSDLRATCFVDVLGYGSALQNLLSDNERYRQATSARHKYSFWFYRGAGVGDVPFRSVEDGYVLEARAKDLFSLYKWSSTITFLYLMQGVLVRGGLAISDPISNGQLVCEAGAAVRDEDIRMMSDQSLIRAHELESRHAKNAVVVVSGDAKNYHNILRDHYRDKGYFKDERAERLFLRKFNCHVLEVGERILLDPFYGFIAQFKGWEANFEEQTGSVSQIYDDAEKALGSFDQKVEVGSAAYEKSRELQDIFFTSKSRLLNGKYQF